LIIENVSRTQEKKGVLSARRCATVSANMVTGVTELAGQKRYKAVLKRWLHSWLRRQRRSLPRSWLYSYRLRSLWKQAQICHCLKICERRVVAPCANEEKKIALV
jgi:hypothetical protein